MSATAGCTSAYQVVPGNVLMSIGVAVDYLVVGDIHIQIIVCSFLKCVSVKNLVV